MPEHESPTTVAVVDDHEIVSAALEPLLRAHPSLAFAGSAATVDELLAAGPPPRLVVLDLRLADGSSPVNNVERLGAAGVGAVAYTSGERPHLLRIAAKAPLLGVVRKSAPLLDLIEALEAAAQGYVAPSADLAAAVLSDPDLDEAKLSEQERRVLAYFADGANSQTVASELGIAVGTVEDYVRRVRVKYALAGRPANTKIDLYKRALEDGLLDLPSR